MSEQKSTPRREIKAFIKERGDRAAAEFFGMTINKMRQCADNPMTITNPMLERWAEAKATVEAAKASGDTELDIASVAHSPDAKIVPPIMPRATSQSGYVDPVLAAAETSQPPSTTEEDEEHMDLDQMGVPATDPAELDRALDANREERVRDMSNVASGWEWKGRSVAILCPWYKTTNPATHFALMALMDKEKMQYHMELGDAMIYHSRNRLADRFLASGCDWALWVDDDIIPPIGNAAWFQRVTGLDIPQQSAGLNVLTALLGHRKTFVGATYMGRRRGAPLMMRTAQTNMRSLERVAEGNPPTDGNRLITCDWVATGCMLTHRSVFESIRKRYPSLAPKNARDPWNYFVPMIDGQGNLEGEDVAFCRRARESGHIVYADLACLVAHVGYQAFVPGARL